MHARNALTSRPPARISPWRGRLSLALGILFGSLFMCVVASAQTGTTGTGSGTGGSNVSTPRPSGATEPRLAQQDQHWSGGAYAGSDYSWIPYTRRGYVGLSLGRSEYDTPCGAAPLSCESRDTSVAVYTGGMFNEFLGLELGAKHFGTVDRAGGQVRAYGANISLVGTVDMENISLYGKAGALYGRTRLTAAPSALVPTGTATGWGPSLTLGLGFNFNRNFTLALERSRDRLRIAGGSRTHIDSTNLALRYRF